MKRTITACDECGAHIGGWQIHLEYPSVKRDLCSWACAAKYASRRGNEESDTAKRLNADGGWSKS